MFKVEKNLINKDECLNFCMDKRFLGHYKYFSEVMLHKDDLELYVRYLKRCEKSAQEFLLVYIDTNEEYKLLGGFTNFQLKDANKTAVSEFFSPVSDCEYIEKEYFSNWQERCRYYILSSNLKRYNKTQHL